ncbi:MAG: hypothetical protein ACYCS9_05730 [Candidatus Dormibacteria bacterium]
MSIPNGQPAWLQAWFPLWTNLEHLAATFFAYLAAIETLIAADPLPGAPGLSSWHWRPDAGVGGGPWGMP